MDNPGEEAVPRPASDLAALVEAQIPLTVDSDGAQDDWLVVGPAILAASVRHLRAIEYLQGEFPSAVVIWQLVRSLFEYVTTFAWIAADPETRAKRWLKYDIDQRLKLDNYLEQLGADPLLDPVVRDELFAYEPALDKMPPVPQRAREADDRWQETIDRLVDELGGGLPDEYRRFRLLYVWFYRNGSRFTHPSSHIVQAFTGGRPPALQVERERAVDIDFAQVTAFLVALGLSIASEAFPDFGVSRTDVVAALS